MEKLQLKFASGEKKKKAPDPEAFTLYLNGRYHWNQRTRESLRKGLECFNQAIEKDPAFALAWAGIADSYAMLVWNIALSSRDGLPKARAAALKALEIDNRLAEPHSSLAFVKLFYDWDWAGAEVEFRRTFELNPDYANARQWYAMELAALGRHEEAIAETERALELDPLSMSINSTTALLFYLVRQPDANIEQGRRTIEMIAQFNAKFFAADFVTGLGYEQKGQYREALEEFQAAVELSSRLPLFLGSLGHCLALAGKPDEAREIMQEVCDPQRQKYCSPYSMAVIHLGLGETAAALDWLERACDERATWMIFLNVHPYFDSLRNDARFQKLISRLNLPLASTARRF
jgi:tetratricopeptide (TPR) repeat protein